MATLVITHELEQDVKRLAAATGTTATEAIADAVHSQLSRIVDTGEKREIDMAALYAFLNTLPNTPDYTLTEDEILGYGDSGAPEQPWLHGSR